MLEYNNKKFLFTGDANSDIENRLVNLYKEELKADVIKVAHHGSNDSSSFDFLKYVKPSIAVISVEKYNLYNHPSKETLERLKFCVKDKDILRTDVNGNIIIGVNLNQEIIVECQQNQLVEIYINWWCVVLFLECLCFGVIYFIKPKNKR